MKILRLVFETLGDFYYADFHSARYYSFFPYILSSAFYRLPGVVYPAKFENTQRVIKTRVCITDVLNTPIARKHINDLTVSKILAFPAFSRIQTFTLVSKNETKTGLHSIIRLGLSKTPARLIDVQECKYQIASGEITHPVLKSDWDGEALESLQIGHSIVVLRGHGKVFALENGEKLARVFPANQENRTCKIQQNLL